MKPEWETLKTNSNVFASDRLKVIGGWLVVTSLLSTQGKVLQIQQTFIKDGGHTWDIEDEGEGK